MNVGWVELRPRATRAYVRSSRRPAFHSLASPPAYHGHGFLEITVPNPPPPAGTRERNSDGAKLLPPSAYLVLNFRDAAPPSPRGAPANATPRRFPLRLITRNLSSGICPSAFSSFS